LAERKGEIGKQATVGGAEKRTFKRKKYLNNFKNTYIFINIQIIIIKIFIFLLTYR
jgi:hypothetical protein